MVKKMNKTEFIKELTKQLPYSEEQCAVIDSILEDNFFISKQSREKIVAEIEQKLQIDNQAASEVYATAINIVNAELKNKLRHPFRSKL